MDSKSEKKPDRLNGYRHKLNRYRYLRIEPACVKTAHLRLVFMGFAALSIGIIVGFNIKDFMIRTCTADHAKIIREMTSRELQARHEAKILPVQHERQSGSSEVEIKPAKPRRLEFKQLPEKFLANTPMLPPANFYQIRPWKVMNDLSANPKSRNITYFLTILVKSAAGFSRRRFHIRQTWGSMAEIEGKKIAVLFVIGIPLVREQQNLLEKENDLYGDIIQGDVSDTYRSLPSKVLSGYQFVTEYMGNVSEYYVSTDDDCFVNVPNTYDYFSNLDPDKRNAIHCGYIYSARSSRITNPKSKWRVTDEIYPILPYPKFCHGGMTVLSFEMLRDIYRVSLVTNYTGFHLEDVLTNGILREKLQKGDSSIRPIYLRDRKTNKKLPLMWHLGYRKDTESAFQGIWEAVKRKLSYYHGPYDPVKGFRAVVKSMPTLEGRSIEETIDYFGPVPARKILLHVPKKRIPVKPVGNGTSR